MWGPLIVQMTGGDGYATDIESQTAQPKRDSTSVFCVGLWRVLFQS